MKRLFLLVALGNFFISANAQALDNIIQPSEVERIEKTLSSNDMMGRKVFTPGIEKAAAFIGDEMKKAGLLPWMGTSGFRQEFIMLQPTLVSAAGSLDNVAVPQNSMVAITAKKVLQVNEKSGFRIVRVKAGDNLREVVSPLMRLKENLVILLDTSFSKTFGGFARYQSASVDSAFSKVFALGNPAAERFSFEFYHTIEAKKLANIVGTLPGKSKKNEYVIFSGHYDHLGIGKPNATGDSLYNGANDDASGVTAVLQLAKYFKSLGPQERTLIFVAFTAEEVGGWGATYFSKQLEPVKVAAMFNIEMIGTDSKWGNNSAYITGYEKTDFGKILEKNLEGSVFKFYPDPYTKQNLFYRSDNATLARLGVPAHTISTSKMDDEPHYHKADDEFSTLDMINMTEIIKAIAVSSKSIVSGMDTPSRVDTKDLK